MTNFRFGSHLPVLHKLLSITDGRVVEFGSGMNSTIFLHWACHSKKRQLLTLEGKWDYYKRIRRLRSDYHDIQFVKTWRNDLAPGKWSVVFIDHSPGYMRGYDAVRFVDSDYVVLHDTEDAVSNGYGYNLVYPLFKYRFDYKKATPHTTVLSNINDVSKLDI
jgi:hypothetical protein